MDRNIKLKDHFQNILEKKAYYSDRFIDSEWESAHARKSQKKDETEFVLNRFEEMTLSGTLFVFCTFTFKQGQVIKCYYHPLTPNDIRESLALLLDRVNAKYLGKAYKRHAKKLACIPIIQKHHEGNTHVHMLLQIPHWIDRSEESLIWFRDDIVDMTQDKSINRYGWFREGNHAQQDAELVTDTPEKCLGYCLRLIEYDGDNDIDWMNCTLAPYVPVQDIEKFEKT